ncbi:hypothetical protein ASG51_02975 [Methylobacterium sp. Leaf465]|nr:hypothetical protein ASG51_02975 [Methylobacterium sp. Leaf465]
MGSGHRPEPAATGTAAAVPSGPAETVRVSEDPAIRTFCASAVVVLSCTATRADERNDGPDLA